MNPVHQDVFKATFALVFLAVPHAGPSKTLTVRFGNACASISKEILGSDSTDLMKALEFKSMFRDILEESWKHQLGDRPIISVYGIDDKVRGFSSLSRYSGITRSRLFLGNHLCSAFPETKKQ